MQLERIILTRRPPAMVFHYLEQFHRVIEWDPSVARAEKRTPGAVGVGTVFEVDVQFLGSTSTLVYRVLQHDAPDRLVLQGKADAYTVIDSITITALASGETRLCYQLQVSYAPAFAAFAGMLAPLIKHNVNAAIAVLTRTLNYQSQPVQRYAEWRDKILLPGLLNFTRRGYLKGKKKWAGLLFDLSGKTILISGATSGLGRAATLALAEMGADIIAVARDSDKAAALQQHVRDQCGRDIRVLQANLLSLAETRSVAETLRAENASIDVLINNAGALFNRREMTAEGLEKSLALLLLSPVVLTESLLPLLRKRNGARVINVVSGGLYTQAVRLDDMQCAHEEYNGAKAYARVKRGLLDMTRWWAAQADNASVVFHAMHPGWADTQAVQDSLPGFYKLAKPFLRTAEQGADTIVWLASAPEPTTCNGDFWLDRAIHTSEMVSGTDTSSSHRDELHKLICELTQPFMHEKSA